MSFCGYLKQSTTVTLSIGPALDDDDAVTQKTGTLADTDFELSKNGGAKAAPNDTNDATHDDDGVHLKQINATDTGTLGLLTVYMYQADVLYIRQDYQVVTANWYDSMCSTDNLEVDVKAVSGDTTAADNLEAQYDTDGLLGDTFPATQAQVGNLTAGTAAINTTAEAADGGFVITVGGTESNDEDSTHALDGTVHSVEDDGSDDTDCYYIFDIGGNGVPVSVTWHGYAQAQGDTYGVYAYNWTGTPAWEQVGSIAGKSGTTVVTETFTLTTAHVGTGSDIGIVHFRFLSDDGVIFATDRIVCSYAVVAQSVGYAKGEIWVDTVSGTAGTTPYVHGVADKPCRTWANALSLSTQLGIKQFHIINGSTITLSDSSNSFSIHGEDWVLVLNGKSIEGASFSGANVTGTGVATTDRPHFHHCHMGAVTLGPSVFEACGIGEDDGLFSSGSGGQFFFHDCFSMVAGSGTPDFNFDGMGVATGVNNRAWTGGSAYTLDADCTVSHEVLAGGGQTFTTAGANVELRGICRSVTLVLSNAGTVEFVGITGPIAISGTATSTVNLYGVSASLADTSSGTTVTDGTITSSIDAIQAKTDNLPSGVAKNVQLANFNFFMVDSTDDISPKTGLTVTAQISKDGGAFAGCSNSVAEIGNGVYKITLTQAEMNADVITLKFTATGANQTTVTMVTDA